MKNWTMQTRITRTQHARLQTKNNKNQLAGCSHKVLYYHTHAKPKSILVQTLIQQAWYFHFGVGTIQSRAIKNKVVHKTCFAMVTTLPYKDCIYALKGIRDKNSKLG